MRVRLKDQARSTVDAVLRLDLVNASANAQDSYGGVPLAALGEVRVVPAETPIYRRNGMRINTVQGFVERNMLPEVALAQVQERIAESGLTLPPGYRLQIGGDADARDEVLRNLFGAMGLIVALTVASIVLTFGSYRLSAITAIVAALSMGLIPTIRASDSFQGSQRAEALNQCLRATGGIYGKSGSATARL